jgi:hypothetical protein
MTDDLEPRMKSIEEYQAMFYKWIDELRIERLESRKRFEQNEAQIEQNAAQIRQMMDLQARLADIQVTTSRILRGLNEKLDDHETRLSSAGI